MSSEETVDNEDTLEAAEGMDESALVGEGSEPGTEEEGAGKKTLGLERWVQLSFMSIALMLVWLYDHLINAIWYLFADPNDAIVTLGAVVAGIVTTIALYRQQKVYGTVHDVADELSKVTWPTRKETSSSTIVVVITSIVSAGVLFLFDTVWSAVTDLVYKV